MAPAYNNMRGIVLMVLAAGALLLNDAATKLLTERYPIGEVIWVRQLAAMLPIVAYVHFAPGWGTVTSVNWFGQGLRGLFFVASSSMMVLNLSLLPLPTVTAIVFASPLFIAAMSGPFLGEPVSWRTWAATLVGFVGVVVIIRPGSAVFEWALLIPVLTAAVNGCRDIATRRVSRTDSSVAILFWSGIIVLAASLPLALFESWRTVSLPDAGLFLLTGALNTGAHFLVIEALRSGQAAVISPFRYSALVWAVIVGFLIWGDLPDVWTLVGASILIGSGLYMMRHR